MNLEQLIQFATLQAEQHERSARHVSGEGEAAEIYRTIAAHLTSLIVQPMQHAPRDGSKIILITTTGVVSVTYDKGKGWVDNYDGPQEYWGPQWVAYDDAFTIDIEETPEGDYCAGALGWMPMRDATISVNPEVERLMRVLDETVNVMIDIADAAARQAKTAHEINKSLRPTTNQGSSLMPPSSLDESRQSFGHQEDHP